MGASRHTVEQQKPRCLEVGKAGELGGQNRMGLTERRLGVGMA